MAFDIKNRWDDTIVYHSELTLDLRAAVLEALDRGANLRWANLSRPKNSNRPFVPVAGPRSSKATPAL